MSGPPGWAERLVERTARGTAAGPSMAGDLREEWEDRRRGGGSKAADRWYVRQAVALAARYAAGRAGDALAALPSGLLGDVRQAARALRRAPGFTAVAVLSLGGGLGLTTVVFSVVNALWLAPPPWPGGDRLVDVGLDHPTEVCAGCSVGTPARSFRAWQEQGVGLEAMGAMDGATVVRTGEGAARRLRATAVSAEVPGLLGVRTEVGRLFTDEEYAGVAPDRAAVLEHGLWVRDYGADPGVLGAPVVLDGIPHTVVGVLAAGVPLLDDADVWLPLVVEPAAEWGAETVSDDRSLWVFGRLPVGASPAAVADRMTTIHLGLGPHEPDGRWAVDLVPMRPMLVSDLTEPALGVVFMCGAGLVLLIASLNLASLLLARITERTGELRLRAALGSSAGRIARGVLVEAVVVAGAGAVVALGVTVVVRDLAMRAGAEVIPPWMSVPMDARVWAASFGSAALAVIGCALLPAIRAAQGGVRGMLPSAPTLRDSSVIRRQRTLLAAQVAVGLALLAGTSASTRAFRQLASFDVLGYRVEGIGGPALDLSAPEFRTPDVREALVDRMIFAFEERPEVGGVVAESQVFLGGWGAADGPSPVQLEGESEPVPDRVVPRHSLGVTAGYFELLGIPILRGRPILPSDRSGAGRVAVVNREAARVLWPGADPIGRSFTVDNGAIDGPVNVVGLAEDVVINPGSSSRRPGPRIYFPLGQVEFSSVRFRAELPEGGIQARAWSEWVGAVDPAVPIIEVTTVESELRRWIGSVGITAGLMGALGLVALLLLALGVSGTLAYQVAAGGREIGVRRALGASARRIVMSTAARIGWAVGAGIAVGAALSALAARLVGSAGGAQVGSGDPVAIASAVTVVVVAAAGAALWPVRRALRVDPVEVLRGD